MSVALVLSPVEEVQVFFRDECAAEQFLAGDFRIQALACERPAIGHACKLQLDDFSDDTPQLRIQFLRVTRDVPRATDGIAERRKTNEHRARRRQAGSRSGAPLKEPHAGYNRKPGARSIALFMEEKRVV